VGAYADEGLRFLGAVGTGFSDRTLADLMPKLRALETPACPFVDDPTGKRSGTFGKTIRSPHWVAPQLVATIAYRELTSGYRFRAPSFKGLRDDLDPSDCLLSDLVPA
jgi:bifunctional non-homologous end joining protein LigD